MSWPPGNTGEEEREEMVGLSGPWAGGLLVVTLLALAMTCSSSSTPQEEKTPPEQVPEELQELPSVTVPAEVPRGAYLDDYIDLRISAQAQEEFWARSMIPSLLRVRRVIDGDTVELEHLGNVRLIGIDTPETVHPSKPVQCYGPEASAFLKGLLTWGRVRLEPGNEETGRYGRRLYYLFREDGLDVNLELVRQGYARVYRDRYPHPRREEFIAEEDRARRENVGLWRKCKEGDPL